MLVQLFVCFTSMYRLIISARLEGWCDLIDSLFSIFFQGDEEYDQALVY